MNKLIQILWKLFLVTFPFSLHFVLYEKATYRFGNFNPWVTGFLFLPEILLITIFLMRLFAQLRITNYELRVTNSPLSSSGSTRRSQLFLCILFILFLLNAAVITFLKGDMWLFCFFLLHILAGSLVYFLIKKEVFTWDQTLWWLLIGALLQVIIAFFQIKLNHSVGLSMLGEPHLSSEVLNVAKNNLEDGTKAIRGYGTFLHPNILGAYLVTILFVSLPHLKKLALIFWPLILLGGIYLTGSQAAMFTTVGLFLVLLILKVFKDPGYRKVIVFGILGLFWAINVWFFLNSDKVKVDDTSLAERIEQNVISLDMFKDNLSGVGVNHFTLAMENVATSKLLPWEFQPVHNVYFLVLNELGIQGLVLLFLLIGFVLNAYFKNDQNASPTKILAFFGLLMMASFDHLLWTSYIGPLLIGLALINIRVFDQRSQ